jgi:transposase-like protein
VQTVIKREYTSEFKLQVIREYIKSPHGIRVVARSFGLPSKNYITRWVEEFLRDGLISEMELIAAGKKSKQNVGPKAHPYEVHTPSARERLLEQENLRLRAELDLLKKLAEIERRDSKTRNSSKPSSN